MVATSTYTVIKRLSAPPYKHPGEGVNCVLFDRGNLSVLRGSQNDPNEHLHTWQWRQRSAQLLNGWVRNDVGVHTERLDGAFSDIQAKP